MDKQCSLVLTVFAAILVASATASAIGGTAEDAYYAKFQCTANCTGGPHDRCTFCGSSCPPTCERPKPRFCNYRCLVNVCECEEDYVRDEKGQCIHSDDCLPKLPCRSICYGGRHDKCTLCGSLCPPTCTNPSPQCRQQCLVEVCQCEIGFVRANNGRCVRPWQCLKPSL